MSFEENVIRYCAERNIDYPITREKVEFSLFFSDSLGKKGYKSARWIEADDGPADLVCPLFLFLEGLHNITTLAGFSSNRTNIIYLKNETLRFVLSSFLAEKWDSDSPIVRSIRHYSNVRLDYPIPSWWD